MLKFDITSPSKFQEQVAATLSEKAQAIVKDYDVSSLNEDKETAAAIRKLIKKEFGLGPRDVSVKSQHGGYSSSVDVTIKTLKASAYISKIESLADGHNKYDTDERTGEILSGGNTFVFTKMDYDLVQEIKGNIEKEYMKKTKGGLEKGDNVVIFKIFQISYESNDTYQVINTKARKLATAYAENGIPEAVYQLIDDDSMYAKLK